MRSIITILHGFIDLPEKLYIKYDCKKVFEFTYYPRSGAPQGFVQDLPLFSSHDHLC